MNSNSGMVVTFVRMSSLFIRYRTILSESRRGKKKENLVNIPVIVHRIFRVLASILPPPLPWYLLLWPRSNRFGCAPFHYFILFSFFFFRESLDPVVYGRIWNRKRATMRVTYGCHVRSTSQTRTHRGQASTDVLISCLWIFLCAIWCTRDNQTDWYRY